MQAYANASQSLADALDNISDAMTSLEDTDSADLADMLNITYTILKDVRKEVRTKVRSTYVSEG